VHDINRCNAAVDVARIYGLVCPVAGCVRYIGKATDPERRLAAHLSSARTGRTKYHHGRWLRKLLADGLSPSVVVLFTVHGDGMTWQQAERFFIASANAFGLPLTNATRGGEGLSLTNPDAALAVSTALRTAWQREDVRAKHSAAMKASHADPAVQAKRAATRVVSDPLRLAASTLGHRTPESRARAGEHFRALWAQPEYQQRKAASSKAAWADPDKAAARRAAMSAGKRAGWARKKMENLRREMEWDTA
jgi:hypothetical protein